MKKNNMGNRSSSYIKGRILSLSADAYPFTRRGVWLEKAYYTLRPEEVTENPRLEIFLPLNSMHYDRVKNVDREKEYCFLLYYDYFGNITGAAPVSNT
jgi:hypothetical protein